MRAILNSDRQTEVYLMAKYGELSHYVMWDDLDSAMYDFMSMYDMGSEMYFN